ncbi:hypothetical protein Tco_1101742 [Tanacetum coccineum]
MPYRYRFSITNSESYKGLDIISNPHKFLPPMIVITLNCSLTDATNNLLCLQLAEDLGVAVGDPGSNASRRLIQARGIPPLFKGKNAVRPARTGCGTDSSSVISDSLCSSKWNWCCYHLPNKGACNTAKFPALNLNLTRTSESESEAQMSECE